MAYLNRGEAINDIAQRQLGSPLPAQPVSIEFYGEDVFHAAAIRQFLPAATAEKLLSTINEGPPLDSAIDWWNR